MNYLQVRLDTIFRIAPLSEMSRRGNSSRDNLPALFFNRAFCAMFRMHRNLVVFAREHFDGPAAQPGSSLALSVLARGKTRILYLFSHKRSRRWPSRSKIISANRILFQVFMSIIALYACYRVDVDRIVFLSKSRIRSCAASHA